MRAILATLLFILQICWWVVIAEAIMSWLIAFNVLNIRNDIVRTIWDTLNRLTNPLLAPIRRRLPNINGLDLSPLVLIVIIYFLQQIIESLYLRVPF